MKKTEINSNISYGIAGLNIMVKCGFKLMDKVENQFYCESKYISSMLRNMLTDMDRYQLCVDILWWAANSNIMGHKMIREFSEKIVQPLPDYKRLKKSYQLFLETPFPLLADKAYDFHHSFKQTMFAILSSCEDWRRPGLFADVFQQHIYSLFCDNQHWHEMVVYSFFLKLMDANRKNSVEIWSLK